MHSERMYIGYVHVTTARASPVSTVGLRVHSPLAKGTSHRGAYAGRASRVAETRLPQPRRQPGQAPGGRRTITSSQPQSPDIENVPSSFGIQRDQLGYYPAFRRHSPLGCGS